MDLLLAAILGALAPAAVRLALIVPTDIDRHDRQIAERDRDLEEWIIYRNRKLHQRFNELDEQAAAAGVHRGGAIPAGRTAVRTLLLYDYREELRKAHRFLREINVEERWAHRLTRRMKRQPFPDLTVPDRAARLIDYWEEGTARNALTWRLEDIVDELPERVTSRALHEA